MDREGVNEARANKNIYSLNNEQKYVSDWEDAKEEDNGQNT